YRKLEEATADYTSLLSGCTLSPGSTLMMRRKIIPESGFFDESLPRLEDWDFLLRYTEKWKIGILTEPLAWIHFYAWPAIDMVEQSLEIIEKKHLARIKPYGKKAEKTFLAALATERVASHFRNLGIFDSLSEALRLIKISPWVFLSFLPRAIPILDHSPLKKTDRPQLKEEPHVLHVITSLQTGGAEGMLTALLLNPATNKELTQVATLVPGGKKFEQLTESGIQVHDLGLRRTYNFFTSLYRLIKIIRQEKPDVVQSWMYHADLMATLALYFSWRRKKTRLIWGIRCSDMNLPDYSPILRLTIWLCKLLSPLPDLVTVNSRAGRDHHIQAGYCPQKILLFENGYDPTLFESPVGTRERIRKELSIPEDATVLIAIARVDPMKDWKNFLDAFSTLPDVYAIAVGEGTRNLTDLPRLKCLGRRDDVPDLLAASDIFISSSAYGEGFSNAIAEAMASNLPIIATDVGDAAYIVGDGEIIVPPRDNKALTDAIGRLVAEPETARKMGKMARERIEKQFSLKKALSRLSIIHKGTDTNIPSTQSQ
ncbi:MAG: glycosyltransferase, partial [Rhodospirillaceae bacterium]|nr:glycosyltransferase [Rhodospirillaceae bacterium]